MKQKEKKTSALFLIVFGFMCVYMLANFVAPKREFSENENKVLAQFPTLTWDRLLDGRFATGYDNYIADQFLLRDGWIGVKSVGEFLLLKSENNGIVYGEDGYLFPKFMSVNEAQLDKNIEAIRAFSEAAPCDVALIAVPSASRILSDKTPAGMPAVNESAYMEEVEQALSDDVTVIDAADILSLHANEYIYYRTDHHWTSYGAWLAYTEFAESRGFTPLDYDTLDASAVEGFLGTSYSKAKNFNVVEDTIHWFPSLTGTLSRDGETYDTIYNVEQFGARDKYAAFLYGNSAYTEIVTEPGDGKRGSILVIKDSYADCLVPYLTAHYERIVLVDLRYYKAAMSELRDAGFDDILFVYGFSSIATETNIPLLTISG